MPEETLHQALLVTASQTNSHALMEELQPPLQPSSRLCNTLKKTFSRVKQDSQYQQEEVHDWAAHLKQFQAILIEFGANGAPKEFDLIRFFREGLKTSIKVQVEQRGRGLNS